MDSRTYYSTYSERHRGHNALFPIHLQSDECFFVTVGHDFVACLGSNHGLSSVIHGVGIRVQLREQALRKLRHSHVLF